MADEFAERVVDAINAVSGSHPGHRAAHAKGTLCAGTFTATPEAARLTRAGHMQGDGVRATVRFSNGSGNPGHPDYATEGRGMAVKLYLPDGSRTDLVALTLPVFFVRTPEDFLEFTRSRKPVDGGQPDMAKVGAFLEAHPEALPAIQAALGMPPPTSYAHCVYRGLHTFWYENGSGEARAVRYRWEPEEGEQSLSKEEARERGPDYLQEDLVARIEGGGFAFRLVVQLGEEGDPTDDPTAAWPDEREEVVVGRLVIDELEREREKERDVLVFDPARVVDGIELSDDPILSFRPRAYSVSVERRGGGPAP